MSPTLRHSLSFLSTIAFLSAPPSTNHWLPLCPSLNHHRYISPFLIALLRESMFIVMKLMPFPDCLAVTALYCEREPIFRLCLCSYGLLSMGWHLALGPAVAGTSYWNLPMRRRIFVSPFEHISYSTYRCDVRLLEQQALRRADPSPTVWIQS